MKMRNKIVMALLLLMSVCSCKKDDPKNDYIILKGKILNANQGEILIESLSGFSRKIKINSAGDFTDTLKVAAGVYQIQIENNTTPVYLKKGGRIQCKIDLKNNHSPFVFSGDYADLNNYYTQKTSKENTFWSSTNITFALEEQAFENNLKGYQNDLEKKIAALDDTPQEIKVKELRSVNYDRLSRKFYYQNSHGQYVENSNYKTSEKFNKELDEIDLSNQDDYLYSSSYRDLVFNIVYFKALQLREKETTPVEAALLIVISTIDNKIIQEELYYLVLKKFPSYKPVLDSFLSLSKNKTRNEEVKESYKIYSRLSTGSPSPIFENYENHNGKKTSLADFKGKYVYIDIWATWCSPCRAEIPFLKKIEKEYQGKNIVFVSISVDEQKNKDKWRSMVKKENLSGVQLITDNAYDTKFIKDYVIKGIPRFILLDTNGHIISSEAESPSNEEGIKRLFDVLKL